MRSWGVGGMDISISIPREKVWPQAPVYFLRGNMNPEITRWLEERLGLGFHWNDNPDALWTNSLPISDPQCVFSFKEEVRDIALLFKLTWGGR